jgi:hypothetical protein
VSCHTHAHSHVSSLPLHPLPHFFIINQPKVYCSWWRGIHSAGWYSAKARALQCPLSADSRPRPPGQEGPLQQAVCSILRPWRAGALPGTAFSCPQGMLAFPVWGWVGYFVSFTCVRQLPLE